MMAEKTRDGAFWMWGLTASIIAFVIFFVGFAVWTFQDDVELVYDNYYAKDVVFEQQIKRVARTQALPVKPQLIFNQNSSVLELKFPLAMGQSPSEGLILLFRPADLHQDINCITLPLGSEPVRLLQYQKHGNPDFILHLIEPG